MITPEEINSMLVIPEDDAASPIKTSEAKFIYHFLKDQNLKRTLETGFAYGKSASHIIAATGAKHIAMDPFQNHYDNLGLTNIKSLGLEAFLEFYPDYSHNVLPIIHMEKEKGLFDFIFIDGDHKFDGEFIDFYYADLLIGTNGYILLHDTWMRSTRLVMSFIRKNRSDYTYIKTPLRNLALYQKTGTDQRNGMHFREFYTLRSFLSYNLITWMCEGKPTVIKRILFNIKERLKRSQGSGIKKRYIMDHSDY